MGGYLYAGLAGALLVLAGLLWWQGKQLDLAHTQISTLQEAIAKAAGANGAQILTIGAQERSLAEFKRLAIEHTASLNEAVADLARAQVARDRAIAHMVELDAMDAARKECRAVLDQDLAACPDILHNMQERAKEP
jgi:hypothetical protein